MTNISDIYDYINEIAPYSLQESYDNSGININLFNRAVSKAMIALDITRETVNEAYKKQAQLIITHHPVIFRPIKNLDETDMAVRLCSVGVSAISAHTNFDSAVMNDLLCEKLGLVPKEPLAVENGAPIGYICECAPISAKNIAKIAKNKLGCNTVRFNDEGSEITRVGICSGSGGSFWKEARAKGCKALITGDVKHDIFVDAHNAGFSVIDAGHFHTENIFCEYMQKILSEKFIDVSFEISEYNRDLVSYI